MLLFIVNYSIKINVFLTLKYDQIKICIFFKINLREPTLFSVNLKWVSDLVLVTRICGSCKQIVMTIRHIP